jgi:hypothetical protein
MPPPPDSRDRLDSGSELDIIDSSTPTIRPEMTHDDDG